MTFATVLCSLDWSVPTVFLIRLGERKAHREGTIVPAEYLEWKGEHILKIEQAINT